ncbi:hypothetical protein DL96DRAFT_1132024 [Flagelloscypha sp. PMI_526]|nr:hypothetical protein DL96DRAFT_1132024 [Flagelloscypha sp. PMI_526]
MGKKNFYVVTRGRQVGLFQSWPEVQPLVSGVENAAHQGYKTFEEADRVFQTCLLNGTVQIIHPDGRKVAVGVDGPYVYPPDFSTGESGSVSHHSSPRTGGSVHIMQSPPLSPKDSVSPGRSQGAHPACQDSARHSRTHSTPASPFIAASHNVQAGGSVPTSCGNSTRAGHSTTYKLSPKAEISPAAYRRSPQSSSPIAGPSTSRRRTPSLGSHAGSREVRPSSRTTLNSAGTVSTSSSPPTGVTQIAPLLSPSGLSLSLEQSPILNRAVPVTPPGGLRVERNTSLPTTPRTPRGPRQLTSSFSSPGVLGLSFEPPASPASSRDPRSPLRRPSRVSPVVPLFNRPSPRMNDLPVGTFSGLVIE